MAWFDAGEAMGALNAIGRDANNFIKRTIEEIEKDLARVDVGAPGIRFGQSRNGSTAGTSGGTMGSETKGPVKKAMACEGCSAKFSFMRRKRECLECRHMYCTQCLPKALPVSGSSSGGWCSRERRHTTCSKCLILLAQPPSRSALLGLKTRDLQAFLASRKVPTHGCLEKDDLVTLVVQLSNYEVNDPRVRAPPSGFQPPPSNQSPPTTIPDRRYGSDEPLPRSEADILTPAVHSFGSRTEVHPPPPSPPSEPSNPPTSPSRVPPRDSLYPRLPTEDSERIAEEAAASIPSPPSASEPIQVPPSGSRSQPDGPPPSGSTPLVPEDGDWVMVDVEERILPPYGAPASGPPPPPPVPPPPAPSAETNSDLPLTHDLERAPSPSRTEAANAPSEGADVYPSPRVGGAGATSSMSSSTPEVNFSGELDPNETEGSAQASSATQSPSLNRAPASVSQGSSPSKTGGPFLMPRDIASSILSSTTSEDDLSSLSVKQLKELLTSSRVDYRGCCEKKELLERAQRLWREYKAASHENLSDDTMCKVCMDANIDCVMLECGHMATCTPCGKRMSECPICRQYVVRIVRIFRA